MTSHEIMMLKVDRYRNEIALGISRTWRFNYNIRQVWVLLHNMYETVPLKNWNNLCLMADLRFGVRLIFKAFVSLFNTCLLNEWTKCYYDIVTWKYNKTKHAVKTLTTNISKSKFFEDIYNHMYIILVYHPCCILVNRVCLVKLIAPSGIVNDALNFWFPHILSIRCR